MTDYKTLQYIAAQMNLPLRYLAEGDVLSEQQKLSIADIYPRWEILEHSRMNAGMIVSHGVNAYGETQLWQVREGMTHTWQADYTPDAAPSLYKRIGYASDGVPLWVQPVGSEDAYVVGDTVSHGGKLWTSTADHNVWEPGVYGWNEVTT